jgi:hypothetical protein
MASAVGASTAEGCAFIAQHTSSKSSACAATAFVRPAPAADDVCSVPHTVQGPDGRSTLSQSRTRLATGSSAPAMAHATASSIPQRAACRAASPKSDSSSFAAKSAS